jgi:hypothetical protein
LSTAHATLRRRHQLTFLAAGTWNLAWGLRTAVRPETFYRTAGLPTASRPEIAACLGMVVGLYGVLYLDVARRPERGGLIAAVGLAGKVLGPAGLALAVAQGRWPARAFLITVGNDLVWWWPFACYLHDLTHAEAQTCRPEAA